MSPAEIKSLVEEVMSQGVSLAWWQSALVLVASGLISAIVALLASYLAKRGELRALNENFEIALTQLKENTRAVKEIEGQIALAYGKELEHYKWEKQVDIEFKKSVMPPRLEALKRLWSSMEPLSPTATAALSWAERGKLDADLRQWYYANGNGIFLSIEAAAACFDARATLLNEKVSDREVQEAFSLLRTQIKIDVGVYSPEEAKRQIGIPRDQGTHAVGVPPSKAQPSTAGDAR
jgi:hypothetical protein